MTAQLIDGKAIAAAIHEEVHAAAAELKAKHHITPGLATVLVGDNPASHSYVKAKRQACAEDGLTSFPNELPAETSQADVLALVKKLGEDPLVHGILVQLPMPNHIN